MNLSSLIPQPEKIPTGAVLPFAANSVPAGWLAANGAAISRTAYSSLFSSLGTTYGAGNGSTTFNLPDLRGYFVRGSGTNSDTTASGTFGAKQVGSFQEHTHTGTASSAGAHTHTHTDNYRLGNSNATGGSGGWTSTHGDRTLNTSSAGAHTHTVTVTATGGTETRPDNIAMLYCIKF
jgi:microcystin-dependent protein